MNHTATAVLWDIDGTLLRAAGTGVRTFTIALQAVTGRGYPTTPIDMAGRTDPDIAALILAALEIDDHDVHARLLTEVEMAYAALEHEFRPLTMAKPGVADALDLLAGAGAVQTLVTGNLESVARRKVTAAGLDRHLRFELGGYGSDHRVRAELVRLSRARLAGDGHDAPAERTWVIGDTPRDLQCAREAGVRCVLVATGTHPVEDLHTLGADAVFSDLSDPTPLVTLITES